MRALAFITMLLVAGLLGWFLAHERPRPALGQELWVDGQLVPDEELQRWMIFGPGHERVEATRLRWICERQVEIQALRAARAAQRRLLLNNPGLARELSDEQDPALVTTEREALMARTGIDDDELESEYARAVEEYLGRHPARHLEAELTRAHRSSAWFRDELRLELWFDRLFFPEPPEEWPQETRSAVTGFLQPTPSVSWREYKELLGGSGWRTLREQRPERLRELRAVVRASVEGAATWLTPAEGLHPSLALGVDFDGDECVDRSISTAELWSEVRDTVEPWELAEIRRWVATCVAVRDRLAQRGAAVTDELRRRVSESRSNGELDSQGELRFPWPMMRMEYEVLLAAFTEVTELASADEQARARESDRRAAWRRGGGRAQVEILLVPALDIPRHRWQPEGWERARARTEELLRGLRANERSWSARPRSGPRGTGEGVDPFVYWNRLLDEESGWWDPPEPRGTPDARTPRNHGRFVDITWSELRELLGENTYTDWVHGESIAERVFFELEPRRVEGPFRCVLGWCLVRVGAREAPLANVQGHADPELLRAEFVHEAFARFAAQARSEARIEGLEPRP